MTDIQTLDHSASHPGIEVERREFRNLPGIKVKTGLRSGAWRCTDCAGEVMGSELFRPRCSYCQVV